MIVILHVMVRTDSALEDKIIYRIKRHALVQYYFLSHCSLAVLVDQHPRHTAAAVIEFLVAIIVNEEFILFNLFLILFFQGGEGTFSTLSSTAGE